MRRRRSRDFEVFSMSFLDTICCAFGAIILLLMITKIAEPLVLEESTRDLKGQIAALQQELERLRGESVVLNRDLTARREQLSEAMDAVARRYRRSAFCSGLFWAPCSLFVSLCGHVHDRRG